VLGRIQMVEFGLCFVTEKARELGQGYGLF
jgi:hypothetical protein